MRSLALGALIGLVFPLYGLDFTAIYKEARKRYPQLRSQRMIVVSTDAQKMYVLTNGALEKTYTVSTGMGGENSRQNSQGTPLGWHRIWLAVGGGEPAGRLIYYKKVTDRMIPITSDQTPAGGDYLITRVLALDGLEDGYNKGGNVDSIARGINIHGTPEEGRLGHKVSHGCVRMANADVIELYGLAPVDTVVYITK